MDYYFHRLLRYLTEKINLKKCDKYVALSNLSMYYKWNKKGHTRTINFKYQLQRGMKNLINLMFLILYQIFKITLKISSKYTKKKLLILQ